MSFTKHLLLASILVSLFIPASPAHSEATPHVMPQDTRVVVFRYDPNQTYTVLAREGDPTNITLGPDEKLVKFILGDTVRWVVADAPGHIFIKPINANLYTAGTIVTNKRAYELQFRSSPASGGVWYQKVSWQYPSLIAMERNQEWEKQKARVAAEKERQQQVAGSGISPENLNFKYEVSGDKALRPEQVFDDGRFTWIQMRDLQTLPALFVMDDGEMSLVNYVVKGNYLVAQRLFSRAVLKRGKREATIVNHNKRSLRKVIPEQPGFITQAMSVLGDD